MQLYLKRQTLDLDYNGDRVPPNSSMGIYIDREMEELTPAALRKHLGMGWVKIQIFDKKDGREITPLFEWLVFNFPVDQIDMVGYELIVFSSDDEAIAHQRLRSEKKLKARHKLLVEKLESAIAAHPIGSELPGIFSVNKGESCPTGSLKNGVYFSPYLSGWEGRGAARIVIRSDDDGLVVSHEICDWIGFSLPDEFLG